METSTPTSIQPLGAKRLFSLEQAQSLVPLIRRVTRTAFEEIEKRLPQLTHAEGEKREALERIIDELHQQPLLRPTMAILLLFLGGLG